jgi:ankyrin repeat protein
MSALVDNNFTVVADLLSKDPSLANIPDSNGWLPLHEAASDGHIEIVQALLKQSKEHINARTSTGGSVLYWALEGQANHDFEHPVIQELLKNGAINYPPDQPVAPDTTVTLEIISSFNVAAAENDVEKLSSILTEHPDVINHSDTNGYQALHEAAQYGHTEAVEFLLEHGASIDTRTGADFDGPTALYLALDNGFESDHPVVVALWNAGAVPLAEGFLFTDVSPEYTTAGFAPQDLAEAVRSGDCDLLAEYAAERPNWLRIMDENGWLPIHEAAILGHIDCVDAILNAVGDSEFINVRVFGTGGNALFWAKQELGEDSEMVQHLVSLGAEELEPIPDEL